MLQYSLKELLGWLTVYAVFVSGLAGLGAAPITIFAATIWFGGTAASNRILGSKAGFTYASFVGFLVALGNLTRALPVTAPLEYLFGIVFAVFGALLTGSIVWTLVASFETFIRIVTRSD